jgi:membrane-associated phospholipid phosphatase
VGLGLGSRLAAAPPLAWAGRRWPGLAAWGQRRADPGSPGGRRLTVTACAAVLAALAFGGLAWDVVGHHGLALTDPHVTAWVVAHRTGWLTAVLRTVTWLASIVVIVPVALTVAVFCAWRRRRWGPLALLTAAIAGAAASYTLIKAAVGRPRPPPAIWIGHFSGAAFPSGHATQSVACYATLAVILGAGRSARAKTALWGAAVLIALIVGVSRIYLGAHWLTDVLGGYALGTLLVAVIVIVALTLGRRRAAMVGSDLGGRES